MKIEEKILLQLEAYIPIDAELDQEDREDLDNTADIIKEYNDYIRQLVDEHDHMRKTLVEMTHYDDGATVRTALIGLRILEE